LDVEKTEALTFITMASRGSDGRGPGDNKPPKDVKGLLELCIGVQGENQDEEDEPAPLQPMSEEVM
jgi:hypothetical protein